MRGRALSIESALYELPSRGAFDLLVDLPRPHPRPEKQHRIRHHEQPDGGPAEHGTEGHAGVEAGSVESDRHRGQRRIEVHESRLLSGPDAEAADAPQGERLRQMFIADPNGIVLELNFPGD
jgi:hypothetical protein